MHVAACVSSAWVQHSAASAFFWNIGQLQQKPVFQHSLISLNSDITPILPTIQHPANGQLQDLAWVKAVAQDPLGRGKGSRQQGSAVCGVLWPVTRKAMDKLSLAALMDPTRMLFWYLSPDESLTEEEKCSSEDTYFSLICDNCRLPAVSAELE